jgi:hypothetical protein
MHLKSYVFTIWHKFRPLGVSESVTYQTHLADKVLQRWYDRKDIPLLLEGKK